MEIQWHGLSCFSIKGKNATVVLDPYDAKTAGIKMPKLSPDIVLANGDFEFHHAVDQFGKDTKVFDWPGEYESKGVIFQAVPAHDRPREKESEKKDDAQPVLLFSMNVDGFRICTLSNLGHKLMPEMLEALGDVDILLLPVGGVNCLDAKKAHEVLEQIDPRVVIPMYYKLPELKMQLAEVELFMKEVGLHAPEKEKSFKIALPSGLPQDKTEFHILEAVVG